MDTADDDSSEYESTDKSENEHTPVAHEQMEAAASAPDSGEILLCGGHRTFMRELLTYFQSCDSLNELLSMEVTDDMCQALMAECPVSAPGHAVSWYQYDYDTSVFSNLHAPEYKIEMLDTRGEQVRRFRNLMQYRKCRYENDFRRADMCQAATPVAARALTRQDVFPMKLRDLWESSRSLILLDSMARMLTTNPHVTAELLRTKGQMLVLMSPDPVYGSACRTLPKHYADLPGYNIHGEVLMALREILLLAYKGVLSICPTPRWERILAGRMDLTNFPSRNTPPFTTNQVVNDPRFEIDITNILKNYSVKYISGYVYKPHCYTIIYTQREVIDPLQVGV
jgi:predicted NAD-dependent protein-ADP-ribosyltransferase YbiA (DUF1768 family)